MNAPMRRDMCGATTDVRYGSGGDICAAKPHVRFSLHNDRESGFPEKVMSALFPEADLCGAPTHFRFGPIADIANYLFSIYVAHSLTRPKSF